MTMDFVNENLTLITPVRISKSEHLRFFRMSLESYYNQIPGFRPKHIFSINADAHWTKSFQDVLDSVPGDYEVFTDKSASRAFVDLIEKVETKYLFMMFGDVMALTDKDIFSPSLESMERRDDICQIHIGGFPTGNYDYAPYNKMWGCEPFPTNLSHFSVSGDTATVVHDGTQMERMSLSGGDTVWIMKMHYANMGFICPFPFWSTIMRSDVAKKLTEITQGMLQGKYKEIRDFLIPMNGSISVVHSTIHKDGWPKWFEFVEEYSHGLLNLASYVYSIADDKKSIEQCRKDHCIEWKD